MYKLWPQQNLCSNGTASDREMKNIILNVKSLHWIFNIYWPAMNVTNFIINFRFTEGVINI